MKLNKKTKFLLFIDGDKNDATITGDRSGLEINR